MCSVCQARKATIGVLCTVCREVLAIPINTTPEQVQLYSKSLTAAALIDAWGRPHALDAIMTIGRAVSDHGLAIHEASVSRSHARITLNGDEWTITDLGSANGTYIDERAVTGTERLPDAACVRFGQIACYFLQRGAQLRPLPVTEMATTLIPRVLASGTGSMSPQAGFEFEEERTEPGLPSISLKLHEPTGGGGGLVELDGKTVQLTATQFELISLMIRRMATESDQPPLVRGFVRSSELIAHLSWDTHDPGENHVKQLVRRVRRALMKAASSDLIESRHRFGYRLRAIPRLE
jgi:FHA domain-containing protein